MPPVVWRGPLLRVPVRQAPPGLATETRRAQNTSLFEDEDEDEEEDKDEEDETELVFIHQVDVVLFKGNFKGKDKAQILEHVPQGDRQ